MISILSATAAGAQADAKDIKRSFPPSAALNTFTLWPHFPRHAELHAPSMVESTPNQMLGITSCDLQCVKQ